MSKKHKLNDDEIALFRSAIGGTRPLEQDKIPPQRPSGKHQTGIKHTERRANAERKQVAASFEFSDGFQAWFDPNQPVKYSRDKDQSYQLKCLRRGDYAPELILDLHGMKRDTAKEEIAALIHSAEKQHVHCVCIVHGIGGNILKSAVPNWLVQHPKVQAFHEAPLEWGGKGALLVLIEVPEGMRK
ncbi:UPF0115 protein [Saliniradius amylolyticus]|uniref:Ribosome rescue factor SmrB n=1 Tax=Saliniradius amylolyticus TaxID=2183582 RepID=A0A2S2E459_9ALTE|nr:endonuclease SmrB [Saliniradius amylolyticus]AWL12438.1 UPF0115 protein [Saliniradius amylolyticus]